MHVAIVYSLPSCRMLATPYGETDGDTSVIAEMVAKGLIARGMTSELIAVSEDTLSRISEIKADCIFNLIEWSGLDIYLSQASFDIMGSLNIPITGSSKELFVLTGDKIKLKRRFVELGIPTPKAAFFETGEEEIPTALPYPLLVKPSLEHCSIGLTRDAIVYKEEDLRAVVKRQIATFSQAVLAEEFVVGREFLVYLIQEKGGVKVLPIEEVIFDRADTLAFQTYETKWVEEHTDYQTTDVVVAKLSQEQKENIEMLSIEVFTKLGFRGYARFDARMRGSALFILEANANPSVYDAAEVVTDIESEVILGIKFPDYLKKIVEAAFTSASGS